MNAQLVKCPCHLCSGKIEFESSRSGETVTCPHCGMETQLFIVRALAPPVAMQPQRVAALDSEHCFLNERGIAVTRTRFMVGSQLFAMANISSVRAVKIPVGKFGPALVFMIGIIFLFAGFEAGAGAIIFAAMLIATSIIWLCLRKPTFQVLLHAAGGEMTGYETKDANFIFKVVQALNQAIIARG